MSKLDPHDFEKTPNKKTLKGGFGKVTFVTHKKTKEHCVKKESIFTTKNYEKGFSFCREFEILSSCNHPAIIKFIGYDDSTSKPNIYLKEAENGSLFDYIKDHLKNKEGSLLDDTHKLIIAYGIARGMEYLHSKDIIHRDLKAQNILLDTKLYPYLADFGTSRTINSENSSIRTFKETTPEIMAPEYIRDPIHFKRTKPIDVFSYAMVLFNLLTEKPIIEDNNPYTIMKKIKEGYRPNFPNDNPLSESWKKLIEKCWDEDPNERPTFTQICKTLESPEFDAGNINRELFISYKEMVDKDSTISESTTTKPETNKSPIEILKEEADEGDPDAQNSYGLYLYNTGQKEDRELSQHYFELAAQNGNHESMLWLSLILKREGSKTEQAAEYLQKSIDSNEIPEAQAIDAQKLIEEGDKDKASKILLSCIQCGSINAMLSYGKLCKDNSQYGNSTFFYKMASNCCHCLKGAGFYLPFDYKVYHCDDCDFDICEACAEACHADHDYSYVGTGDSFQCQCTTNEDKCTAEFVGEAIYEARPTLYQHLYQCKDCNHRSAGKYICRACKEKCHEGHNVIDCGIQKGYCSCGTNQLDNNQQCSLTDFKSFKDECPCKKKLSETSMRFFRCLTCDLHGSDTNGICEFCANNCHKGHIVVDCGIQRRICNCKKLGECKS